jgi:hypothetical protein
MADPLVRVALVNYGNDPVKLVVETKDLVQVRQLLKEGAADKPDGPKSDKDPGAKTVEVPGGMIVGFSSAASVTVTNPTTVYVAVVTANGKDPWPKPPPPAPAAFTNVGDYKTRFANFLLADGVQDQQLPSVMIAVPAIPR